MIANKAGVASTSHEEQSNDTHESGSGYDSSACTADLLLRRANGGVVNLQWRD
jgi:hypothetical protein